jgi:hypothetical protein
MNESQKPLDLSVEAIQYFPSHRCPRCDAPASSNVRGHWYIPYRDYFGSALKAWESYFGYVYFACDCAHQPGSGMRVARVGDALIPLEFSGRAQAHAVGWDLDVLNAHETAQAVDFLIKHADPARTAAHDELQRLLFEVASGALGPEQAHQRIQAWVFAASAVESEVSVSNQLQPA